MANQGRAITVRAEGATNLSAQANIGFGIALDANGRAVLMGADATDFLGVLTDGGRAAGDPVTVQIDGTVRARAGAAMNEGDWLTGEAGGRFVPLAGGAGSASTVCGKCIQRGGAADLDLFDMLIAHAPGPAEVVP